MHKYIALIRIILFACFFSPAVFSSPALAVSALAAPGSAEPGSAAPGSAASAANKKRIIVSDFLQRTVQLKQPAQRIIALAPHIVENVYAAGAGQYLVGAVEHCDYPEAAKQLPRVGAYNHYSLEAILALKPDLVILWHSGQGPRMLSQLEKLNIPTYASEPHTLEDVAKSLRDIGRLSHSETSANQAADTFLQQLQSLKQNYQHLPEVSTLYQVWNKPIQTLNDKHMISDVIRLCGGRNAFGSAPTIAPKISVESVIAQNPQVIIASGMGEERPEWLNAWKKWPAIHAVKHHNLYFIPPDIIQRHTVRILEGASMMCKHLDKARKKAQQ